MKISTKGQYALEAMVDMVTHTGMELESIRNIAARRNLSDNYLEQLFLRLRRNGVVESVRGAQGGYRLARDPSELTVRDILRAVEGELVPVHCLLDEDDHSSCGRERMCATRKVWMHLMREMNDTLAGVTLRQLADAVQEEERMPLHDYSI